MEFTKIPHIEILMTERVIRKMLQTWHSYFMTGELEKRFNLSTNHPKGLKRKRMVEPKHKGSSKRLETNFFCPVRVNPPRKAKRTLQYSEATSNTDDLCFIVKNEICSEEEPVPDAYPDIVSPPPQSLFASPKFEFKDNTCLTLPQLPMANVNEWSSPSCQPQSQIITKCKASNSFFFCEEVLSSDESAEDSSFSSPDKIVLPFPNAEPWSPSVSIPGLFDDDFYDNIEKDFSFFQ